MFTKTVTQGFYLMAYITNRRVYGGVGEWFFYWFDISCFSKKWRLGAKTGLEDIIFIPYDIKWWEK